MKTTFEDLLIENNCELYNLRFQYEHEDNHCLYQGYFIVDDKKIKSSELSLDKYLELIEHNIHYVPILTKRVDKFKEHALVVVKADNGNDYLWRLEGSSVQEFNNNIGRSFNYSDDIVINEVLLLMSNDENNTILNWVVDGVEPLTLPKPRT
jgi:hypothetical protein